MKKSMCQLDLMKATHFAEIYLKPFKPDQSSKML